MNFLPFLSVVACYIGSQSYPFHVFSSFGNTYTQGTFLRFLCGDYYISNIASPLNVNGNHIRSDLGSAVAAVFIRDSPPYWSKFPHYTLIRCLT